MEQPLRIRCSLGQRRRSSSDRGAAAGKAPAIVGGHQRHLKARQCAMLARASAAGNGKGPRADGGSIGADRSREIDDLAVYCAAGYVQSPCGRDATGKRNRVRLRVEACRVGHMHGAGHVSRRISAEKAADDQDFAADLRGRSKAIVAAESTRAPGSRGWGWTATSAAEAVFSRRQVAAIRKDESQAQSYEPTMLSHGWNPLRVRLLSCKSSRQYSNGVWTFSVTAMPAAPNREFLISLDAGTAIAQRASPLRLGAIIRP